MADYNVRIHSKILWLRYKYRDVPTREWILFHPVGKVCSNLSVVYPDYLSQYDDVDKKFLSIKAKRKRYKNRLRFMINKYRYLFLVTLTFTDSVLSSTDSSTRLKYVQRWCKSSTLDYFGCVDYGKKNGREHFHIICAIDSPLTEMLFQNRKFYTFPELQNWLYGFASCRFINPNPNDSYSTLNYAFKSALYAFKSSQTNSAKPFFSRKNDYSLPYYYVNSSSLPESLPSDL